MWWAKAFHKLSWSEMWLVLNALFHPIPNTPCYQCSRTILNFACHIVQISREMPNTVTRKRKIQKQNLNRNDPTCTPKEMLLTSGWRSVMTKSTSRASNSKRNLKMSLLLSLDTMAKPGKENLLIPIISMNLILSTSNTATLFFYCATIHSHSPPFHDHSIALIDLITKTDPVKHGIRHLVQVTFLTNSICEML